MSNQPVQITHHCNECGAETDSCAEHPTADIVSVASAPMTTAESITRRQIRQLRDEARNSVQPDWLQEAICTLALEGSLDSELNELNLTAMQFARVQHMTQAQAIAECARVIAHAEAQS